MLIDTKFYEDKYEEFKERHPYLVDHVRSIHPRGESGIRVTLDDGTKYDYGSIGGGVRRVVNYSPSNVEHITDDSCRKAFVYKVTELMEARGFTQQTLAEYSGVSKGAISKYLNEKATPSFTAVMRIATALGCTLDELSG